MRPAPELAQDILRFWFHETKPFQWYRRDADFDENMRRRFLPALENARRGRFDIWRAHPQHALALVILLDQFSRNIFRDGPRAFAQDALALDAAKEGIARRFDWLHPPRERAFFYMPFMHSEDLSEQDHCVHYFKTRMHDAGNLRYAIIHRNIIKKFGRFPHRNQIFDRQSTQAELQYLKTGGFNP